MIPAEINPARPRQARRAAPVEAMSRISTARWLFIRRQGRRIEAFTKK